MKNIIIKIENNDLEIIESNGFQNQEISNGILLSFFKNEKLYHLSRKEFLLNMKGVFVEEKDNYNIIYTDIFRTIPLYYTQFDKALYIFSDFITIKKYIPISEELDLTGFWEYLLFGNGVFNRTIYSNIKQFPTAGRLTIKDKKVKLDYYYDFNIYENKKYSKLSSDEIVTISTTLFANLFKSELYDISKEFTLGLSGGMDSRLAFSLLKELDLINKTNYFTYGYDEKILESKIAQDLLKLENIQSWSFHKLTNKSYQKAFEYFPEFTAASISSSHVHMYDYISQNKIKNLISTYYSDAVFGYSTSKEKQNDSWLDVDYFKILDKFTSTIPVEIQNIIKDDIRKSLQNYDPKSNYSSINEYKYIVERNPKFHMNLLHLQSQLTENNLSPFANYEILKFMMELPLKYRYDKQLVRNIIRKINPNYIEEIEDTSNQRVYFKKNIKNIIHNIIHNSKALPLLGIKLINICLFKISKGRLYIFDKYSTELHSNILAKNYNNQLKEALEYFLLQEIINKEFYLQMLNIPSYGTQTAIRFEIIDLYLLIKGQNEKN